MPAPIYYAHRLVERQAELRKNGKLNWLRPDAKSQITLRYEDGKPVAIDAVVLSTQHDEKVSQKEIHKQILKHVIKDVLPAEWLHKGTQYHINPTGQFIIGGPVGDCGLTGRKIIVDTYGGMARHGGGAFLGKRPFESRPFGSLCFALCWQKYCRRRSRRSLRDSAVVCDWCCRADIDKRRHLSALATFRTLKSYELVREHFELRPKGLIAMLDLMKRRSTATRQPTVTSVGKIKILLGRKRIKRRR